MYKIVFCCTNGAYFFQGKGQKTCQPKDHVTCTHLLYCFCSTRDCGNGMRGAALSTPLPLN